MPLSHVRVLRSVRQSAAKKMAPCLHRGPAVELLPLQALQQGAGERIPVAIFTLWHLGGICQDVCVENCGFYRRKSS